MFEKSNRPAISLANNQLRTLSTDVASYFEKQHQVIMRQVRQIMANCPESFNRCNFALVEIKDAKGELRPRYSLTRDAFMLVVMGFTGHKAMQCKLAYIEEFNRMEAVLSGREIPAPEPKPEPAALPAPAFVCPYVQPSPDLSFLPGLISEKDALALEKDFATYNDRRREFAGLVKRIARTLGRCAAEIEVTGHQRKDEALHRLADIIDPGRERWHGFDDSMFTHIDQMITHCRSSFKFLCGLGHN